MEYHRNTTPAEREAMLARFDLLPMPDDPVDRMVHELLRDLIKDGIAAYADDGEFKYTFDGLMHVTANMKGIN